MPESQDGDSVFEGTIIHKYSKEYYNKRVQGEDIGYTSTPLTYPGELVVNAGETIVSALDKIKNQLNNFEYFYDLDGNFVFQQKKNSVIPHINRIKRKKPQII